MTALNVNFALSLWPCQYKVIKLLRHEIIFQRFLGLIEFEFFEYFMRFNIIECSCVKWSQNHMLY